MCHTKRFRRVLMGNTTFSCKSLPWKCITKEIINKGCLRLRETIRCTFPGGEHDWMQSGSRIDSWREVVFLRVLMDWSHVQCSKGLIIIEKLVKWKNQTVSAFLICNGRACPECIYRIEGVESKTWEHWLWMCYCVVPRLNAGIPFAWIFLNDISRRWSICKGCMCKQIGWRPGW